MSDTLRRIKHAVHDGNYVFSEKAVIEMEADGLTEYDVVTSILSAPGIYKTIRSRSTYRHHRLEYLHVIVGASSNGLMIYSKGKLAREYDVDVFYLLISSKRARR